MYSSALSETTFSIIWGTLTLESDNNQGWFFKIKPQSVATSYFLLYCIMLPSTSPCPCHLSSHLPGFAEMSSNSVLTQWSLWLFSLRISQKQGVSELPSYWLMGVRGIILAALCWGSPQFLTVVPRWAVHYGLLSLPTFPLLPLSGMPTTNCTFVYVWLLLCRDTG